MLDCWVFKKEIGTEREGKSNDSSVQSAHFLVSNNNNSNNIPSLPPFRVMSDEKLVEDLEPKESKLSKESSLLWLTDDGRVSLLSIYQISPYPLSLPLRLGLQDSPRACRERTFFKIKMFKGFF